MKVLEEASHETRNTSNYWHWRASRNESVHSRSPSGVERRGWLWWVFCVPPVLWHWWLDDQKDIWPLKYPFYWSPGVQFWSMWRRETGWPRLMWKYGRSTQVVVVVFSCLLICVLVIRLRCCIRLFSAAVASFWISSSWPRDRLARSVKNLLRRTFQPLSFLVTVYHEAAAVFPWVEIWVPFSALTWLVGL